MNDNSAQKIAHKICQIANLNGKKVLEIGCGNGRVTALFSSKPKEIIAIDPEKHEIESARKKIPGVNFQIGSGENLIFSDETFDVVIFTLSLHHQNSELAISAASRVLKHNGEMIIIEPLIESEIERMFSLILNENQAKLNAQNSIKKSNLRVVCSEVFTAKWFFDDKNDLFKSVFNYYNMPFDSKIGKEIIELIGEKADSNQIELQDLMEIQLLNKA